MERKGVFGMSVTNFNTVTMGIYLFVILLLYLLFIGMFSLTVSGNIPAHRIFALLAMISWAAAFVGGLIGFLFSIPRVLPENPEGQHMTRSELTADATRVHHNDDRGNYRVNTNLELVSDWLTKILVGVGLTQFHNIKAFLVDISAYCSSGLTEIVGIQAMISAIIVLHVIVGFLAGYLLTRVYLSGVFAEADEELEDEDTSKNVSHKPVEVSNLTNQEKDILQKVLTEFEQGNTYTIPEGFTKNSEQQQALLQLGYRHLIPLKEGGGWQSGDAITLTQIAQQGIENIKQEIANDS